MTSTVHTLQPNFQLPPTPSQTVQVVAMSCPESVTLQTPAAHAALVSSIVPRLRMLRAVIERLPQHFTPYKTAPKYRLTYYIEKLECGHERMYFPQAGPMAKRRHCCVCASASSLPLKKPSASVTENGQAERVS